MSASSQPLDGAVPQARGDAADYCPEATQATGPLSPLASVPATRQVLERFGLATKKALGQHFLVSDGIVRHICQLAELSPGDSVLEIGPGIGTLTYALAACGANVMAVERDPDLPPVLAYTCERFMGAGDAGDAGEAPAGSLVVLNRDAMGLQAGDLPFAPAKLVANLPYAVAATLVLDAFQNLPTLRSATVMVQQEVADRMAARPGTKDYGAFTVKLALYAKPAGRFNVAPGNFFPPPRVNITVIRLDRHAEPLSSASEDPKAASGESSALAGCEAPARLPASGQRGIEPALVHAACTMADAAFANRRKTICNSCRTYFAGRGADVDVAAILQAAGIDPARRGETLDVDEYLALGRAYLDCAHGVQ